MSGMAFYLLQRMMTSPPLDRVYEGTDPMTLLFSSSEKTIITLNTAFYALINTKQSNIFKAECLFVLATVNSNIAHILQAI